MNRFVKILLNIVIKLQMRKKSQTEAVTDIYYEIAKYLKKNYSHYDENSYMIYPSLNFKDKPKTVDDFIKDCQRDSEIRAQYDDSKHLSTGC